jgi:hypothetical protein
VSDTAPTEKVDCPYAVLRFDTYRYSASEPWNGVTVVSLFDDKASAEADVARLQALRESTGSVYFVQRVKKYFRRGGLPQPTDEEE